jgi:hypothetical protein
MPESRICVIGFVDRTGSNLGVNVDLASATSFEDAFAAAPPSTAVYFLKKAAALQQELLAATTALESALGFKVQKCKDLSNFTVEDLRNRQNAPPRENTAIASELPIQADPR